MTTRLLGQALSGSSLSFISATATHKDDWPVEAEVVCETKEHCDAVAAWAEREGFRLTTRVATADELADHRYWQERM